MPNHCMICKIAISGGVRSVGFNVKKSETLKKWKTAVGKSSYWKPGRSHRICMRHFTLDSFIQTSTGSKLLDDAVPTQEIHNLSIDCVTSTRRRISNCQNISKLHIMCTSKFRVQNFSKFSCSFKISKLIVFLKVTLQHRIKFINLIKYNLK